jgi:NMD protein affecting ribosome stability and mRNA decay
MGLFLPLFVKTALSYKNQNIDNNHHSLICPECGAVYSDGHWVWEKAGDADYDEQLCPACLRIRDDCPAGFLTLLGAFLIEHKKDILRLIHNASNQAKVEHPLHRIIRIDERDDGCVFVSFTDQHLARGVGQAVHDAFKGDLNMYYQPETFLLQVNWTR